MAIERFETIVDFTTSGLRLICGFAKEGQPYVLDSLYAQGTIMDAKGNLDIKTATTLLKSLIADARKDLKTAITGVTIVLPPLQAEILKSEAKTATVADRVDEIDGQNCLGIIRRNLSLAQGQRLVNIIPVAYSINETEFVEDFPKGQTTNELMTKALVSLANQNLINATKEVVGKAGLDVNGALLSIQMSTRFLKSAPNLPRSYLLLDMGSRLTTCAYCSAGNVIACETIFFGGADLTRAVAKAFNLTNDEAENYKHIFGIAATDGYEFTTIDGFTQQQLADILRANLAPVVELIARVEKEIAIDSEEHLVVTGGGSYLCGLSAWLAGELIKKIYVVSPQAAGARYRGNIDLLGALLDLDDTKWLNAKRETRTSVLRRKALSEQDDGNKEQ